MYLATNVIVVFPVIILSYYHKSLAKIWTDTKLNWLTQQKGLVTTKTARMMMMMNNVG